MTEYELVDALASLSSSMLQGQALTITTLSAYMVVAYTAGANLTRFQVVFISSLFVIFGILGIQGQNYALKEFLSYTAQLNELRGGIPRHESVGPISRWTFLGVRLLLIAGALTFMWRVRHPKTE
jgi:hypothetical protein